MHLKKYFFHALVALAFCCSCEGPEGKVGPAGKNSLVMITDEAPGANCANGGQKILTGVDQDGNGQLSDDEVNVMKYVCNGKNSFLNVVSEPAGSACPNGGLKIESGVDLNVNNSLESHEVIQTKFLCNGLSSLTVYTNEPAGVHCQTGGFKMETGLDLNGSLMLDPNEVESTKFICIPGTDKQIRLEIGESNVGTQSTDWFNTPFQTFRLIKFNKLNYAHVDSITFVPSLFTPSVENQVYVQLYNWTDHVEISNSEISSNVNEYIFKESRNLYDQLPNKEITLGIRVRSQSPDYYVTTGIRSYLFIYKH